MKSLLILILVSLPLLSFGHIYDLEQIRIDYEYQNSQRLERVSIYLKEENEPINKPKGLVIIRQSDGINAMQYYVKIYNSGASTTTLTRSNDMPCPLLY